MKQGSYELSSREATHGPISNPKASERSSMKNPDDEKRFVVRADEKLTAFVELESAINRLPQDEILKPCNAAAV
jgi:hypothetical protein